MTIVPELGMGATHMMHSDRRPFTIIEISNNGRRLVIQEDTAVRTDTNGFSEQQTYTYDKNPEGVTRVITLRQDGAWREVGETKGSSVYHIGSRRYYYDYSF